VHPQTRSITDFNCISILARLWPPSSNDHGLQVHISKLARSWPPGSSPTSLNHGLRVRLQTRSITASNCIPKLPRLQPPSSNDHDLQVNISKLARSRPPGASPNSLDHGLRVRLQTRSITASNCISKLARSRPPSSHDHGLQSAYFQTRAIMASGESPNSLDDGLRVSLQTHPITASKFALSWPLKCISPNSLDYGLRCISKFAQSRPPSVSPNSPDHGLQLYLQTHSITASKFTRSWPPKCISLNSLDYGLQCISKFARSRPPSASPNSVTHGLQLYFQRRSITASKCISKPARSSPRRESLSSLDHGVVKWWS